METTTIQQKGGIRTVPTSGRYPLLVVAGRVFVFPDNAHPKKVESAFYVAEDAAEMAARGSDPNPHLDFIAHKIDAMRIMGGKTSKGKYEWRHRTIRKVGPVTVSRPTPGTHSVTFEEGFTPAEQAYITGRLVERATSCKEAYGTTKFSVRLGKAYRIAVLSCGEYAMGSIELPAFLEEGSA